MNGQFHLWIIRGLGLAVLTAAAYTIWAIIRAAREKRWGVVGSALVGAVLALLGILAGLLGSVHPDPIEKAPPISWFATDLTVVPIVFWASVTILLLVAAGYYTQQGRGREDEVASLIQHSSDLHDTLRTLPPEGFMKDFPALCESSLIDFTAVLLTKTKTRDQIEKAIRVTLRSGALLAQRFDRSAGNPIYSANLMRYRPADALGAERGWKQSDEVFYPEAHFPPKVRGALMFDPQLSTTAASHNAEATGLPEFRLMIPEPPHDRAEPGASEGRLLVLPGACTAFVRREIYRALNTHDFRYWIKQEHFLAEEVIAKNENYFLTGPGKAFRSFISIPIFPYQTEGVEEDEQGEEKPPVPIGVLNINSSVVGLFGGNSDTVNNFALATAPLLFVLRALLTQLEEDGLA